MDSYFPEYAGVFSDMFGSASLAVLEKSPMPFELLKRKAPSLARDRDISEGRQAAESGRPRRPSSRPLRNPASA